MGARLMTQDSNTRVVHCQHEPYDIYIGRPGPWGNPFRGERQTVINQYREWVMYHEDAQPLRESIHTLRGKTLGCWCKPKDCHGDVLVELLNNDVLDVLNFSTDNG